MKTITTALAGIFGMIVLLTTQNVKAQTYYAFTYGTEKQNGYSSSAPKSSAVVISNVYKIDNCSKLKGLLANNLRSSINSTAMQELLNLYKQKQSSKRSPWYLSYTTVETFYTTSYDEATSKQREVIKSYERRANDEALYLDMSLECNQF